MQCYSVWEPYPALGEMVKTWNLLWEVDNILSQYWKKKVHCSSVSRYRREVERWI